MALNNRWTVLATAFFQLDFCQLPLLLQYISPWIFMLLRLWPHVFWRAWFDWHVPTRGSYSTVRWNSGRGNGIDWTQLAFLRGLLKVELIYLPEREVNMGRENVFKSNSQQFIWSWSRLALRFTWILTDNLARHNLQIEYQLWLQGCLATELGMGWTASSTDLFCSPLMVRYDPTWRCHCGDLSAPGQWASNDKDFLGRISVWPKLRISNFQQVDFGRFQVI